MKCMRAALGLALAMMVTGACTAQEDSAPLPPPPPAFDSQGLGQGPWTIDTQGARLNVEVLSRELERPWGLAFLPDGAMLVTERPGRLRIVRDGVLDPRPIEGLPPIFAFGISGLTDVVLHPQFERNRMIYLAYSKAHPDAGPNPSVTADSALAVMRARWDGGYALTDVEEIFLATPWYGAEVPERCCGQGPAFGSYGGRMTFGPDGKLYVTSGDRNYGELVQDPSNHAGKVVRLNDDGSAPQDNPFVDRDGWQPEIWSTGHRNPTGLTYDVVTDTLWSTEFGPRGGDELNRIERGANYGWMEVTQGHHYDGTPATGIRDVEGMTDPVLAWGPPSHNPGNIAVYRGAAFPAWEGDLLVAMMNRSLERIELDADGAVVSREPMLQELGQRLRDVRVSDDGTVYVLTDENEGALLKITPAR